MTMPALNLAFRTLYQIDGLMDRATGLTDYSRWTFHGWDHGRACFRGSTADSVWVDRAHLTRVGRQHLRVDPADLPGGPAHA
jgi:hypothetical protein